MPTADSSRSSEEKTNSCLKNGQDCVLKFQLARHFWNKQWDSMYYTSPQTSRAVGLRPGYDRQRKSEHYADYNHLTYIHEMTRFIMRRRSKLQRDYEVSIARQNVLTYKLKDAMKKRMIYQILGFYPAVRHKLRSLGWVEKIDKLHLQDDRQLRTNFNLINLDSAPYILKEETVETYNAMIGEGKFLSEELYKSDARVDLLFSLRKNYIPWNSLHPDTIISYFPRTNFCSKIGLNMCLEHAASFGYRPESFKYPRGYNVINDTSMKHFTQDFRETSCFSLMRYVARCADLHHIVAAPEGTISWTVFDSAEKICQDAIRRLQLENITPMEQTPDLYKAEETEEERETWSEMLQDIFNITSQRFFFQMIREERLDGIHARARIIVNDLNENYAQEMFDGRFNVWLVKPIANCSGHGIRIFRQLEDIKRAVRPVINQRGARWVIQKYIERPFLIHGVKFDLRLWFVVTNIHRFKIWVYHEGYVRFCSKPHSNTSLDEARHLTNVRIQRNYRERRDPSVLPVELMWDFRMLRDYFVREMDQPRRWEVIMKAMEDTVITVMRCALNTNSIGLRRNAFQLFGADFLIHENLAPCLIEVNNGPGLSPTTSIIAKKTTELLTDMVKVVVAEKDPISCHYHPGDVGKFRLVYNEDIPRALEVPQEIQEAMESQEIDLVEWRKTVRLRQLQRNMQEKRKLVVERAQAKPFK